MVIDRLKRTTPLFAIANSLYLSYIYLQAFYFEKYSKSLIDNFSMPFLSIPLIFFSLFFVSFISKEYQKIKTNKPVYIKYFIKILILLVVFSFIYGFCVIIYNIYKNNYNNLFQEFSFILVEIVSITFAVGKNKSNRIMKVFGLFLLWTYTIMGTFCALGYYEQYLGYSFSSDLRLIYSGIFFHLFNATFLVYSWYESINKK